MGRLELPSAELRNGCRKNRSGRVKIRCSVLDILSLRCLLDIPVEMASRCYIQEFERMFWAKNRHLGVRSIW